MLRALLVRAEREPIRFAVAGAFAMGALGVPRATADLDFLVHQEDLDRWDAALVALGYGRTFQSENASHYRHPEVIWGSIDVLHAFRPISVGMLARARRREVPGTALSLPVVEPEDLIGLKVQALANDPDRFFQDMADIEAISRRHRKSLDWDRLREYYRLFDKGTLFDALFERHGKPDA